MNKQSSTPHSLLPTSEIIARAKARGVNFGKGDPNNRIRYYTKIGLLPHAQRRETAEAQQERLAKQQQVGSQLTPKTEGHYPETVIDLLVSIDQQLKAGKSIQTILRDGIAASYDEPTTPLLPPLPASTPVIESSFDTPMPVLPHDAATSDAPEGLAMPIPYYHDSLPVVSSDQTSDTAVKTFDDGFSVSKTVADTDETALMSSNEQLSKHFPVTGNYRMARLGTKRAGFSILVILLLTVFLAGRYGISRYGASKTTSTLPSQMFGLNTAAQRSQADTKAVTQVLAAETGTLDSVTINADTTITGNLTAPNIIYGLTAGSNITISQGQHPTISATLTEKDTLASVTARGNTTATALSLTGGLTTSKIIVSGAATLTGAVSLSDALNLGNLASDPASATNGATYYNTTSNKFRCYQNGSWTDCITALGGSMSSFTVSDGTNSFGVSDANTLSFLAGTGIALTTDTTNKKITITSTATNGVISITGTADEVIASSPTGAVTLSLPQAIATTSSPTFAGLTLNSALTEANGGTGQSSYTKGDILYASAANVLSKLNVGSAGQVLTVDSGTNLPKWGSIAGGGGICSDCVITDPTTAQTIKPATADITGLSVAQSGATGPTANIFTVTNNSGATKYLVIDNTGSLIASSLSGASAGVVHADTSGKLTSSKVALGTDTSGNYVASITTNNGITGGNGGGNGSSLTLGISLTAAGAATSSTTSSGSGLEFTNGTVGLLRGCANTQLLKWDSNNSQWICANDQGATSAIINVEDNGTKVGTNTDTLNFSTDFAVTASSTTDNIGIDYSASHITRDNTAASISAAWSFTSATLTSPKIVTSILDTNSAKLFDLNPATSAVNYLTYANAATGVTPSFTATGTDTNVGISFINKGTGAFSIGSTTANSDSLAFAPNTSGTNAFTGIITSADLTATRTYTLPNTSGTVCLDTGNCAGAGSGVTVSSSGAANTIAMFTGTQTIANSIVSQNSGATTLTITPTGALADTLTLAPNTTGIATFDGKITSADLTAARTYTLPDATGNFVLDTAAQTLTNKTIAAGNNAITGLTNANLSGTAGITNANLANSSVTVTAGTGLSGGGAVSLGSSITLNNSGVLSVTGTANQVIASAATGNVTLSLPQAIGTSSTPTFGALTLGTTSNQLTFTGTAGITGTLSWTPATTNKTITFPNTTGTVCLDTGNCAGAGTGVTVSSIGTANTIAMFTGGQTIANSIISQNSGATTLTLTPTGANADTLTFAPNTTSSATFDGKITTSDLTAARTFTFPDASGNIVLDAAAQTLTNKTIAAGNNAITGLTNANLSGTAGITNANLANSSVTVTAGSGLSGGGTVSLGSTITLTNAGVTSASAGTGISLSGATGGITITNTGVTSLTGGTDISLSGSTGAVTVNDTSTLATVTGRGASTSTQLTLNGGFTGTQTAATGDASSLTDNSLAPASAGTADVLNLKLTNISTNATGTSLSAGLTITPTINITSGTGTHNTTAINLAAATVTCSAGTCNTYGIYVPGSNNYTDILNYNGTSVVNSTGQLNLGSVTGTLAVANGGTGAGTLTGILIGNGTSAVSATTTSSGIANAITDETGTGSLVFATSPSLTTPSLGAATATSINKVTITAPTTSATLTLADGSTFATSGAFSTTLTSTAATSVTLPTSGTLATLAGTETLTNKTLTSPKIGTSLLDTNGNTYFALTPTASANNYLTYANAANGSNPSFTVTAGSDTNAGLNVVNKGTGAFSVGSTTANSDAIAIAANTTGASAFTGTITSADLTAAQTYTLPNSSGTVCLSIGNCAGSGSGVTASSSGTANTIAMFTAVQAIANSIVSQNSGATTLTVTPSGANADTITIAPNTTGSATFDGKITTADLTAAHTYTFPNATGIVCLDTGNCAGAGGGITGSGNAGQVAFFNGTGTIASSGNFTWDNTHNLFGVTSATAAGNAIAFTDSSLTTGSALNVSATSSPTAASSNSNGVLLNLAESAATNPTTYNGLDVQFTNNPSVAGNTENAVRIQNEATTNTTDNATAALLLLDNADTNTTGSTVVTDAIRITNSGGITNGVTNGVTFASTNIANGLNFSSTPAIDYVSGTNWTITAAGAETLGSTLQVTGAISAPTSSNTINSLVINSGALSSVTGYSQTSGNFTVNGSGAVSLGTGSGNVSIGNSTGTLAIASNGGLNVTTGGALTGVASLDTISTSATALSFAGAGSITSNTTNALTLDSGTTGTLNLGTGNNAKTINIGTGTAGNTINIATDNTTADAINIGSAKDTTTITGAATIALGSSSLTVTGLGSLPGGDTGDALCTDTNNNKIVTCTVGSGGVSGSGNSGQVAFFTGGSSISSSTNFTWNNSTNVFGVTSNTATGSGVSFTDNSLAPAASGTANDLNLVLTNVSTNATGTSLAAGLTISPTVNVTSGAGTHNTAAINLMAATNTACSAGTCNTYGIYVPSSNNYSDILNYNGTSVINSTGQLVASQLTGTLFNVAGTGGSSSAIVQNGTLTIAQGTGITTSNSGGTITVTNAGVTSATAGTGISLSGATGGITITNTGVTSLTGGTDISLSGSTGAVTVNDTSTLATVTGRGNTSTSGISLTENGNTSTSYGLYLKRNTDTSPAGYLIQAQNSAANSNLFAVDVNGLISTASVNSTSIVDGSVANVDLANSSLTVTAGSGLSGGGLVSLGGSVTLTNAGVTSNVAGTDISVSGATGAVTINNTSTLSSVTGRGASTSTTLTLNGGFTGTQTGTTGDINSLTDTSLAPAAAATASMLDLIYTNSSTNATGTSTTAGLTITPTVNVASGAGTHTTIGLNFPAVTTTCSAGTCPIYGLYFPSSNNYTDILNVGGSSVITGSGLVNAAKLSGTLFNVAATGGSPSAISQGGTVTIAQGTGITTSNSGGTITVTNAGVTAANAGTGISLSGSTGAVTITNAGVTSNVAGTDITVSGATGAVTINDASTLASVTSRGNTTATGIALTENGNTGTSYGLYLKRNTDTSPLGYLIQSQNAAANSNLFAVDVNGLISTASVNSASIVDGSVANVDLANSSLTVTAGSGLSGGGLVSLGGSVTLTNAGVTSASAGTGISLSGATGGITITNTGVTSLTGGTDISLSGSTGAVTVNDTSTLATVTGRGASTSTMVALNGGFSGSLTGTTGDINSLTDTSLAPAAAATASMLDLVFTNHSSNATGTSTVAGLTLTPTVNVSSGAGTHNTAAINLGAATVTCSAGTCNTYGIYVPGSNNYTDILNYNGTSIINSTGVTQVAGGGTGTSTAFTSGSVVFAGASGVYNQDNSNFYYNATNHRLGLGNTSPAGLLDVSKTISGTPSLTGPYLSLSASTFTDNNTASGTVSNMAFNSIAAPILAATNLSITTTNAYTMYIAGAPAAGTNETITNALALGVNGNTYINGKIGVGTTSPSAAVDIATNGAASTPGLQLDGTWFSGGTSTTTKPQLLIEPTGTTSNNWSTAGTALGINAASSYTGDLANFQIASSSKIRFTGDQNGTIYFAGGTDCNAACLSDNSGSVSLNSGGNLYLISHNGNNTVAEADAGHLFEVSDNLSHIRLSVNTTSGNLTSATGAQWLPASDSSTALQIATSGGTAFVDFDSSNKRVGIGTTGPTALLSLAANTTSTAQINLASSSSVDVSTPNSGDLWWNGTNLYFRAGGTTKDLLASGGSGTVTTTGSPVSGQVAFFSGSSTSITSDSGFNWDNTNKRLGLGTASPAGMLDISKALSGAGTLTGPYLSISASTYTASSTSDMAFNSIAAPTLAASGTQTTANAYTLYVAGAPTAGTNETITNAYALGVNGAAKITGGLTLSNYTNNGGLFYANGSGVVSQTAVGTTTQCLTGGSAPAWEDCTAAANSFVSPMTAAGDLIIGEASGDTNYALSTSGASVTVDATFSGSASNIIDGNDATEWDGATHFSASGGTAPWVDIDLGSAKTVSEYRLDQATAASGHGCNVATQYTISYSTDNSTWNLLYTSPVGSAGGDTGNVSLTPTTARYWKVIALSGSTSCGWTIFTFGLNSGGLPAGNPGRLAIGSTNNVLKVVGGLPAWGSLDLAQSGTVGTSVLGVANGGTGDNSALTQGSVVIVGSSGAYTQDNSNFFYNASTHRLGLGNSSPAGLLDVSSTTLSGAGSLTGPFLSLSASTYQATSTADMAFNSIAAPTLSASGTQTTANAYTMYIAGAPTAGTNETITNAYALGVNGNTKIAGTLTTTGNITGPATGNIGYWTRSGTTLSPLTGGDAITTTGNISTTGTGTITSAGLLTGSLGATISGAATSINASSNFNTTINTGTSTGAVTIGNSSAGALTLTSGAAINLTAGAASTITLPQTTSALAVASNSTNYLSFNTNGSSNPLIAFGPGQAAIDSNFPATYSAYTFSYPQVTMSAGSTYTAENDFLLVNQPLVTAAAAATVNNIANATIAGAVMNKAGSNLTLAADYALKIDAGTSVGSAVTNAYSLYVDAPTGASNNYAAVFNTGNVGIGTTSPASTLTVTGSLTSSGGTISLNRNGTAITGINDGSNSGAITIGNTSATPSINLANANTTGTGNNAGLLINDISLTSGTLTTITTGSANTLTSGTLLNIASTSTAGLGGGASYLLNLSRSGANTNASHTAYGIASSVTNTGTTSTNYAGYFTASGGTTNWGLYSAAGTNAFAGNTIIGATTTPGATLDVESSATTTNAAQIVAGSLSSGIGLSLSSTSTSLSSGQLAKFDWTPGSSTTTTGDVFSVNLGANGNANNIFNVTQSGSTSDFSVSQTTTTSSLPLNVTAPGDVAIAYDLNFTNPTASNIKSAAPLYITSGETFNSSDLNLTTYNEGDIYLNSNAATSNAINLNANNLTSGNGLYVNSTGTITGSLASFVANSATTGNILSLSGTGLTSGGSVLNITANATAGTAALKFATTGSIVDMASGTAGNTMIMKLPRLASGSCATATAQGLIFQTTSGTQVGHACISPSGTDQLNWYAQSFNTTSTDLAENYSDASNSLEAGDVVAIDTTTTKGAVKASSSNSNLVFGVVSTQPGLLLTGITETGSTDLTNPKPVALSGRVPVKVSTANGAIHQGDYLTASATPGVAVKATSAGQMIGQALENYTNSDTTAVGKILVFVNAGYADPAFLNPGQNQTITGQQVAQALQGVTLDNLSTKTLAANVIQENQNQPLEVQLTADGTFEVVNSQGNNIFGIDDSGNATISGTLTADTIKANHIEGLEILTNRVSALEAQASSSATASAGITFDANTDEATVSGGLAEIATDSATGNPFKVWEISKLGDAIFHSIQSATTLIADTISGRSLNVSEDATIGNGLKVLSGVAQLPKTTVGGTLTIGAVTIDDQLASIDSLNGTLHLQALAGGGVDFISGKVVIDPAGNVTLANGNLNITQGVILGNNQMRGIAVPVTAGQTSFTISFPSNQTSSSYAVTVTPNWLTQVAVTSKSANGYTVTFSTPAPQSAKIDWILEQ